MISTLDNKELAEKLAKAIYYPTEVETLEFAIKIYIEETLFPKDVYSYTLEYATKIIKDKLDQVRPDFK